MDPHPSQIPLTLDSPPKLIGPFTEILTLDGLSLNGPIKDDMVSITPQGGVLIERGRVVDVGAFSIMCKQPHVQIQEVTQPSVLLPGFVDAHTHLCYAGSRARDYALRVAGVSYMDIAKRGGGILDTVIKTRAASEQDLQQSLKLLCDQHLKKGITTCEIKSGYGLNVDDELKMLRVINAIKSSHALDIVPTCLAAHVRPKEFEDAKTYLEFLVRELLPLVKEQGLANRVDIFVEDGAFGYDMARAYLEQARALGFSLVVHADQFTVEGSKLAADLNAVSADHLEASTETEMRALAAANVACVVLPGSSLGLGGSFANARKMLDVGCSVVIASDTNPGTAPLGDLLTVAAILGAYQNLSMMETFAALTFRAAHALELNDRGSLAKDQLADMTAFPCSDYREILYHQGQLQPSAVWKKGERVWG